MTISKRTAYYLFVLFLILFLGSALFITSCNNISKADRIHPDSLLKKLPAPDSATILQTERMRTACQAWYDSALKPKGFNGGMLVAWHGNIIFETYQGTAHLPGSDPMNENTALHIASVSKTFTAMAVLKLWQDGKLNIDDEFSKYFPEFNYPGVTIRSLLNHRSGLPNYIYFIANSDWDKSKFVTNEDILDFLINRKDQIVDIASPNSHFSYSNTNYALLALLIEKTSGLKYDEYLKQNFFIPLRMKNTYVFRLADSASSTQSYNWRGKPEPYDFLDEVYGDKNIYTTARDLLAWDKALSGNMLFRSETLEQAYTPYSNEKPGIRNYGLGWRMYNYPTGKKIIYHNGRWHGSNACFIRVIDDSATIIVIGNRFTRAVYHAKVLTSIFGNYSGTTGDEENEPAVNENNQQYPVLTTGTLHKKKKSRSKKRR